MWARHDTEAVDRSTALRSSCRLQRTVTAMFMGTPNNTTRTNTCGASRVLATRATATLLQYHGPHPLSSSVLRLAALCVLLLPIGVVSAQSCKCDTSVNRGALIDLYDATNGASWTTPWNISNAGSGGATVCDWAGVVCDNVTGNVTELNLAGRGLTGTLSASVTALSSLATIDVSSNALSGTLPDSLGMGWPQLSYFRCTNNSISGTLPASYSSWSQLTYFLVGINNITGTLPEEYSAWSRLVTFRSYRNQITGTLPASYSAWSQLTDFEVFSNSITGSLPPQYGAWSLTTFMASDNQITGTLPASYSAWSRLSYFDLSNNSITGTLPPEYSAWSWLDTFLVNTNQITGTLPESYNAWSQLLNFQVFKNNYTGTLPPEYSTWSLVTTFFVHKNQITGTLPTSYSVWSELTWFDVSSNNITGTLPSTYTQWTWLRLFNVYLNRISGSLPAVVWPVLTTFNAYRNSLSGTIPWSWGGMTMLQRLYVHANQLSGTLPASLGAIQTLTTVGISGNAFTGTVPEEWGAWPPRQLSALLLQNNLLRGTIPASWTNLFVPFTALVALCNTDICGPLPFAPTVPLVGCVPESMLTLTPDELSAHLGDIVTTASSAFDCTPIAPTTAAPATSTPNVTRPPVSYPVSETTATMVATRAVSIGASAIGIAAGPLMGVGVARVGGALRLVECNNDGDSSATYDYALGLLIAYLAAALLCVAAACVGAWHSSTSVVAVMRRWGMPGNFGVVACGLGPELLSSGVSLVAAAGATGGTAALGVVCVAVGCVPLVALCWGTTAGFGATFMRRASRTVPADRSVLGRLRRAYEGPRTGRWVAAAGRPAFVDCYGPLFDELTGGRAWYVALQCVLAAGVSVCGGVAGVAACSAMQVVGGALQMGVLVSVVVCRAQRYMRDLCMALAVELLGFVGGLLVVVVALAPAPMPSVAAAASTTLQVQLWLGVGLGLMAGVHAAVAWWSTRRQGHVAVAALSHPDGVGGIRVAVAVRGERRQPKRKEVASVGRYNVAMSTMVHAHSQHEGLLVLLHEICARRRQYQ